MQFSAASQHVKCKGKDSQILVANRSCTMYTCAQALRNHLSHKTIRGRHNINARSSVHNPPKKFTTNNHTIQNVYIYKPPVTSSTEPVTYELAGEQRNSTASASSSGFPKRPIGILSFIFTSTFSGTLATIGVSMKPGMMALQRILCLASSKATVFVKPTTPAFEAA